MKKTVSRSYYVLTFTVLALVVSLTVLPILSSRANFIFDPAILSIIFAMLSLAISMVLFGVLGDSEALIKQTAPNGLKIQMAGSAAGFIIFFYLFTKGLSPLANARGVR